MQNSYRFPQRVVRCTSLLLCFVVISTFLVLPPLKATPSKLLVPREPPGLKKSFVEPSTMNGFALRTFDAVVAQRDRQSLNSQVRQLPYSIEVEELISTAKASAGQLSRQDMRGFGQGWSRDAQLFWGAPPPVDKPIRNWPHLTLMFNSPAAATYEIVLYYTSAPDYGTFRVFLQGEATADVDGYSPNVTPNSRSLGQKKLAAGNHQFIVTVFTKNGSAKNYFVGLDRIVLRRIDEASSRIVTPGPVTREPDRASEPVPLPGASPAPSRRRPQPDRTAGQTNSPGASNVQPIPPGVLTRAVCYNSPQTCCGGKASGGDGCRLVTEALLDIQIRSYVPARFTVMGRHSPWDTDFDLANIVSDVNVSGPFKVWPGCRFSVTEAVNTIEDSKSILQKAAELFEAWLGQWSGGVESAKSYVSEGVADEVCKKVNDSQSCRDHVAAAVKTGINLGLASLGIPPEIPDVHQLRQQGIRYLAAEAASSALGDPEVLKNLPVDEKTREILYQQVYDRAFDAFSEKLNKVIPPSDFDSKKPSTWGHLEPAYAPHNAHVYVEVRVKEGAYPKYLEFLGAKPNHKWQPLYLHDLNHAWASRGPIDVPSFIPPDGLILPIELKPYEESYTKEDTLTAAQIPGVKISRTWLEQKVGLSAADGVVRGQINYLGATGGAGFWASEWDEFYDPIRYLSDVSKVRKSKFRLLMPIGGVLDWEKDWDAIVANVRDRDVGYMVVTKGNLHKYFGRLDPAPRCDGKPNVELYK